MGRARGIYDGSPGANSFPGYPLESYRTWGGFDWMTATVGGLWDSLLAEGRPWWITANSDSHQVYADTAARGGGDFNANGRYDDPVYAGRSTSPRATTGRASTAAPTSAPTASPTPPSWTASAPAASGSTTASSSAASTSASRAAAAGPPSAAPCTSARAPGSP